MTPSLVSLRHELHQHPELSGQESETAARIGRYLQQYTPTELISGLGGHGVAAVYRFSGDGPTVLIRCELDALPIEETNVLSYRSCTEGVSHKCGHDGHMAIVAGLSPWLAAAPVDRGRVILLFQPAEETGKGAKAVLDDPRFTALLPDYAFALHNIPGYPLRQVLLSPQQFSASVQSVAIYLQGKQAHAAQPEQGVNPADAIAELITAFSRLVVSDTAQSDFALLTPVHMSLGQADYGISAGSASLHYTLRCWTPEKMQELTEAVTDLANQVADKHQLQRRLEWVDHFPTVQNDPACQQWIGQAAARLGLQTLQLATPFRFGEDFGWFSQRTAAAMFGLGAGLDQPALHHNDYDFPDELIASGTAVFRELIKGVLAPPLREVPGEG